MNDDTTDLDLDIAGLMRELARADIVTTYAIVWGAVVSGRFPATRIRRSWRIRVEDVPLAVTYFRNAGHSARSPSAA
jgi:hypothetical protein